MSEDCHECQLGTNRNDILYLPVRSRVERICDAFRKFFMASHKHPGTLVHLHSSSSLMLEKRRHLRNHTHIIHPFSIFRLIWDFTIILTLSVLLVMVPYQAAFDMVRETPFWTFYKNIGLFIGLIDVVVNFMTGYFNENEGTIEMRRKQIAKRYTTQGTFIFDIIGSIPTDLIFIPVWNDRIVTRELTSLLCGLRVFSLISYINRMTLVYNSPEAVKEFCVVIFWMLLYLHWLICLEWIVPIAINSNTLPERPGNGSWSHGDEYWNVSRSEQYFLTLTRAVLIFTRSGFIQAKSGNLVDLHVVTLLLLLGMLITWIMIARTSEYFKGVRSSRLRYQGALSMLKRYMRHKCLPLSSQQRIKSYYGFNFQRHYFRESEIMNTLSAQMRQEIRMHSCRNLVENVEFFHKLPLNLLGRLVLLLKSEIFLSNDVIVRAHQIGDCMYFIASGTVAIYTSSGREICHLEDGAHFGEIALVMPNELRVANVIAVEVCKLYRLNRVDFERTIQPYPILWEHIKKIALDRRERISILEAQR